MKRHILTLCGLLALSFQANSATLTIGAGLGAFSGVMAQLTDGTVLSEGGYYIGVGVFDTPPTMDHPDYVQEALATFTEFGNATSPTTGATQGRITASITAIPSNPATFNSKEVFLLIGNGATKLESTQFAILRGTPTWTFPADTVAGGATAYTLSSIASFEVVPGFGCEIDGTIDTIEFASLTPCPEPTSTFLLALVGACAGTRRRR